MRVLLYRIESQQTYCRRTTVCLVYRICVLEVVVVLVAEPLACRCLCYGTPTHCALSCMLNGRWSVCVYAFVCVCFDYLLLLMPLFVSDRWQPTVLLANKIQSQLFDQKVLVQPSKFPSLFCFLFLFSPFVFTFASLPLFTFCFIDVVQVLFVFGRMQYFVY